MVAYPARAFPWSDWESSLTLVDCSLPNEFGTGPVNTHFVRTQCDLGNRLSKFTTELMAGEWEWGISSDSCFQVRM